MDSTTKRGALGVALIVFGFLAIGVGWSQLRQSEIIAEQVCFAASGGLAGLVMVLGGSGLIASSNSHMRSQRLEKIEALITGEAERSRS